MGTGDVAGDGKPEAGAAFVLIARVIKPQERLEDLLPQMRRDTRAVVVHGDGEPAVVAMTGDGDRRRMPRGVGDEVAQAALECGWPHRDDRMPMKVHTRLVAVALGVRLELLQECAHVGWRRLLAPIPAREGEIGLQ